MTKEPQRSVHHVLAHSYAIYFVLFILGVLLDTVFKFKVFPDSIMAPIGFVLLVLASIIIFSAQKAGRELRKIKEKKTEHFFRGPYRFTRIPTHWGLFFLVLGFGVIINSFFVIVFTIISFFISKFFFISKYDKILEEKYGAIYAEYKKLVKF